jgi:hypothetical protein
LLCLINESLKAGEFPDGGKLALVRPIFKKDNPHLPQCYRPISLLPSIAKVLEKVVCNRLLDFLEKNDLIFSKQFAFQRGKSTKLALIDFTNKCIDALERGETAIGCFLDLSKAFDCVNHVVLVEKLQRVGFQGTVLNWLISYISNRQQKTVIDYKSEGGGKQKVFSELGNCSAGVPQGSILGPILFLIYVNDISSHFSENSLTIFADDTTLFARNKSIEDLELETFLQLNSLAQYFSDIDLKINPDKTQFLHFSTHQRTMRSRRVGCRPPAVFLDNN